MDVRRIFVLMILTILFPLFLGGCSSTKRIGDIEFEDGTMIGFGIAQSIDPLNQNIKLIVAHMQNPDGTTETSVYQVAGEGFFNNNLTSAAIQGGSLVWAARELRPNQTTNNNSNSADGGSANADGGDSQARAEGGEGGDSRAGAYSVANADADASSRSRYVNPVVPPKPRLKTTSDQPVPPSPDPRPKRKKIKSDRSS